MSKTPLEMVREYHERAKLTLDKNVLSDEEDGLRKSLLLEEAWEAIDSEEKEELIKELADVLYVTYGWAASLGWDLDEAFRRVHENNMGRMVQEDGTIHYREDGKVLKNKNYPKVYLGDLV